MSTASSFMMAAHRPSRSNFAHGAAQNCPSRSATDGSMRWNNSGTTNRSNKKYLKNPRAENGIVQKNLISRQSSRSKLLILLLSCIVSAAALAQEWSTAISSNPATGRVIVFRYISNFPTNFNQANQPVRIILEWRYEPESGLPSFAERERMDALEDVLQHALEGDGFATLTLVSTGESLREWTYYAKSEKEFFSRLNDSLATKESFPIKIHVAADPDWSVYKKFIAGVRE